MNFQIIGTIIIIVGSARLLMTLPKKLRLMQLELVLLSTHWHGLDRTSVPGQLLRPPQQVLLTFRQWAYLD